ncbi:MAG: hypothetical protein II126_04440 [Erysipelotrichaceae bacterium]|nr:hypothetical protein [Erysipelotrichaceae bacterium]
MLIVFFNDKIKTERLSIMGPIFELIFLLVMIYWVLKAISKFGRHDKKKPKRTAGIQIPYDPIKERTEPYQFSHKLSSDEFIKEAENIRIIQKSYGIFEMENSSMTEYIEIKPNYYKQISCHHTDKKTGVTTEESIKIEPYYFVLFKPGDLLAVLRRVFSNHPCVKRNLSGDEAANIRETFRIAKEKSLNLADWLEDDAEIRNPDNYTPHKRLDFPYSETFSQYRSDCSEKDIIVYRNHSFWQNEDRTALITIHADDHFKADVFTGCYDGIDFSLRKDTVELPEEFYTYCFIGSEACSSPEKVKEALEMLPDLHVTDIVISKKIRKAFIRSAADCTVITEDKILYSFQDPKERDTVYMWPEVSGSREKDLKLSWDWFYAYTADDLSALLRKEYPELAAESEKQTGKALKDSPGIGKLFAKADSKVAEMLGEDEYARSKELREVLRNVTAYRESYGDYINRNDYDKIEGNARFYNYLKINRGFTAVEAVEQYLRAKEVYASMKNEGYEKLSYGLHDLGTHAFNFNETIVMAEGVDMIPDLEEDFLEKCRQNGIMILEMKGDIYHDHVSGDDYRFEKKSYVELDHDATSVLEKDLIKIEKNN